MKLSRIDLEQQIALLDEGPFPVMPREQIAGDLRPNLRVHQPIRRPDPFGVDRDILLYDFDDDDVRGLGCLVGGRLPLTGREDRRAHAEDHAEDSPDGHDTERHEPTSEPFRKGPDYTRDRREKSID